MKHNKYSFLKRAAVSATFVATTLLPIADSAHAKSAPSVQGRNDHKQSNLQETRSHQAKHSALVVVGDSYGVGLSQNGYALPTTAIQGKTIAQITKQLENVPRKSRIIVCGGTNDANGDLTEARLKRDVHNFFDKAKEHNLVVSAWVGPTTVVEGSAYDKRNPKLKRHLSLANRILQHAMKVRGIPYVDLHEPRYAKLVEPDGLHKSSSGFAHIRKDVIRLLREARPNLPNGSPFMRSHHRPNGP